MHVDDIPVLSGASWLGHMRELRHDRLGLFRRFNRECGAIGRLQALGASLVLVNAPELLHEMLIDKARRFRKPPGMLAPSRPLVGDGLFTSDGELWHRQRRLMAPLFTHAQSARYVDCMAACAWSSALELEGGHLVDVAREMTRITMRIAGKTLFDAEVLDEADRLGAALTFALRWVDEQTGSIPWAARLRAVSALEVVAPRLPEPFQGWSRALARALVEPSRRTRPPGEKRREADEALATIERRVARMISERHAVGLSRPDLLSRLLGARDERGEAMNDRQVRDEIVTLFIAGHETTATALAWSFYLLGRHPEAHARARAEARALGDRKLCSDDLPKLGYCLEVFKEALRLYPPLYLFGREAATDVSLGDFTLPRGTIVLVSPYALHHRPELWPDPERFEPDRFEPEADSSRHRLSFLPFGAGSRACIGNHFALMEGPIVLATILGRVDLELARLVTPETSATLRPKGGVPMWVTAVRGAAGE